MSIQIQELSQNLIGGDNLLMVNIATNFQLDATCCSLNIHQVL